MFLAKTFGGSFAQGEQVSDGESDVRALLMIGYTEYDRLFMTDCLWSIVRITSNVRVINHVNHNNSTIKGYFRFNCYFSCWVQLGLIY